MKSKILNLGLVLSSLIGYLEWGGDNSMFLIEGEIDVLVKLFTNPLSVLHPFTLLPLTGQILLLISLFQERPGKRLTYIGIGCIAILLVFMFAIGIMSTNFKILLSTVPFLVLAVLTILHQRKQG